MILYSIPVSFRMQTEGSSVGFQPRSYLAAEVELFAGVGFI
jgi:hypothetical protein